MNYSGQPEITLQEEGIAFCRQAGGVPMFLTNPVSSRPVHGSMPIISLLSGQPMLVREGYLPHPVLENLLGMPLDSREMRRSNHPLLEIETRWLELEPVALRRELLATLYN